MSVTMDDSQLQATIQRISSGMQSWQVPLGESEKVVLSGVKKNFASAGGYIAGGWAPRKQPYPWAPLIKTGKMRASTARKSLSANRLEIHNTAPYYKYHQTGTSKMAQRQVLGINPQMKMEITMKFARYIRRLISS